MCSLIFSLKLRGAEISPEALPTIFCKRLPNVRGSSAERSSGQACLFLEIQFKKSARNFSADFLDKKSVQPYSSETSSPSDSELFSSESPATSAGATVGSYASFI